MICPLDSESSREHVKVSHVIVEKMGLSVKFC